MAKGDGAEPRGWRFSDGPRVFRLYPQLRMLLNGEERVRLGERGFDLLALLIRNAGHVVGKQEIFDEVWAGATVTDGAVSSQISIVRTAITTECIVNVPMQGYVFRLPVEPIEALPPSPELRRLSISLPHPSATGVGRTTELTRLTDQCVHSRLVTVVGPGGVGKTWLAVELGWRLVEHFPDGVHLIDLGPVRDSAALTGTVAQALGVALRGTDDPARVLSTVIGKQRMLLIFDSCEYLADSVRTLIKVFLSQAPSLAVLATSQVILELPNEVVSRLDPLPEADAVALFEARARAADDRFQPGEKTVEAVAEICRRLDGIPLALEMAAGLVPRFGVERVRSRLAERFRMLDSRKRLGEPRQATLSAMVDWSFGLLDEEEQQIFRRLAVFRGGFSEDAAAAIAWPDGTDEWEVAAELSRFADKSLLAAVSKEPPRYRMLETIGLYTEAKLKESGEGEAIAERHARYFADLFERADLVWETTPEDDWLALYAPDLDNLRTALDWALAEPDRLPIALTLAGAAGHLWERVTLGSEGRAYLDQLIERIDDSTPPADAARVFRRASVLWRRTDNLRGLALMEQAVSLYRQIEDKPGLGTALAFMGGDYVSLGRLAEAGATLDEACRLLSGTKQMKSLRNATNNRGNLAVQTNDLDEAREHYARARDLAQKLGDSLRESVTVLNLGEVEFRAGAIGRAMEYARQSAASLRSAGRFPYLGWPLVNLASYLATEGKDTEARHHAAEALSLLQTEGGHWLRLCLQVWALLGARDGRYAEAAQLLGFVDADYIRSGEVREPTEQRIYVELSERLAANLPAEDIRIWTNEGGRWSEDQAATFASRRVVSPEI